MRRYAIIATSILLVVCGVVQIDMAAQERVKENRADKQNAGTQTKRTQALQTLHDEARATYEAKMSHYETRQLDASEVYTWSIRWRAAATKGAENEAKELQASKDHLDRMRDLHKKVTSMRDEGVKGGEHHIWQATRFYVAEGELFLMEAGGDKVAIRDK